jgi:Protein of unknown function DUF262
MNYRNTEMKLDQLVSYLNEQKINLSPAFQRGHVWSLRTRRKLIANIVQGRPIPAIFLYKEASGARYSYNILDGKQRLESLILFIGNRRQGFAVSTWAKYFFSSKLREEAGFWVQLPTGKKTFQSLDEQVVRDFREYAIPTVEINLTDESYLDEIINLFVDINQQGVQVGRFDIVRAMGSGNRLLWSVFGLLAVEQRRAQDVFYRSKSNDFTFVLKTIHLIGKVADGKSQVDRMWQQMLELVLFYQSKRHRKPGDILKSFISGSRAPHDTFPPLSRRDEKGVRELFRFIANAYRTSALRTTPLATDLAQFYTMCTSLIDSDLRAQFSATDLIDKLVKLGRIVDGSVPMRGMPKKTTAAINTFVALSADRTTDAPRREERQHNFIEAVKSL